jgi:hypothetical protein
VNFKELLLRAKDGEAFAVERIAEMYRPLLIKESIVNGVFDEDLYQELWLTLLNCVRKIKI